MADKQQLRNAEEYQDYYSEENDSPKYQDNYEYYQKLSDTYKKVVKEIPEVAEKSMKSLKSLKSIKSSKSTKDTDDETLLVII